MKNKFYVLGIIFLMLSCMEQKEKIEYPFRKIETKVILYINSKPLKNLNIAEITPFFWDKVYIFKPYTSLKKVNSTLGFIWEDAAQTSINSDDKVNLLVFIKKNKVVKYIRWDRSKGDFLKIKNSKQGYSYEKAQFFIEKKSYENGLNDIFFLDTPVRLSM